MQVQALISEEGGGQHYADGWSNDLSIRDDRWSESIALVNLAFIDEVRSGLGFKAAHRDIVNFVEVMRCGSPAEEYALKFAAETEALSLKTRSLERNRLMKQTT